MDSTSQRLKEEPYLNWVRETLCVQYLKEAIEDFSDTRAAEFHAYLQRTVPKPGSSPGATGSTSTVSPPPQTCTSCISSDILRRNQAWQIRCGSKLCSSWLKVLLSCHRNAPVPTLFVGNFDPRLWPTHPWEVAKLYQPYGCGGQTCAKEADVSGLLNFLKNCQYNQQYAPDIQLIEQVLEVRNRLMHTDSMCVDETQFQQDTEMMIRLLESLAGLSVAENQRVNEAMDTIKKVQSKRVGITLDGEMRALNARTDGIAVLQGELQERCALLEHTVSVTESPETSGDIQQLQQDWTDMRAEVAERVALLETANTQHQEDISTLCQKQRKLESDLQQRRAETPNATQIHDGSPQISTEIDIARLRSALIKCYVGGQSLLVPNPVVDEALGLEEIYVRPDVKVLRETTNPRAGLRNTHASVISGNAPICKSLFYTNDYANKQIYVTGNAGVGKSIFCKYLVNLWCDSWNNSQAKHAESKTVTIPSQTQSPSNGKSELNRLTYVLEEDMKIMSEFKLVFYITLRDSSNLYNTAHMIDEQILKHLSHSTRLKAVDVLQTGGCLIVLDGLDEWTCPENAELPRFVNPGIPGRDVNSNNVYVTTTRPWKLDVLKLKGLEIDKHVKLCGLNEKSSNELCSKYTNLVNELDGKGKGSSLFAKELKNKGLYRFHNVPNILLLLIGLWFDNQTIGQSTVQLFCSMLEMLLKRASEKNLPGHGSSESVHMEKLLPGCFGNRRYCLTHQQLLRNLSKVAFEALLDVRREDALVFNASHLGVLGIGQDSIYLCLKTGILSQEKVLGKRSVSEKKLSFLHKQLQEMLAAVYISSNEKTEHVTARIHDFCSTVENTLELSQVWVFLSGIRPDLARELLTDVMHRVVINDDRLQQFRQNVRVGDYFLPNNPVPKSIQTLLTDCVRECRSNDHGHLCLPLYDFVIDNDAISTYLEGLFTSNSSTVKSIYIDTDNMTDNDIQTLVRIFAQLRHVRGLQALFLVDSQHIINDPSIITDMSPLCQTLYNNTDTLICLALYNITLTTRVYDAMRVPLHHVTTLVLFYISMAHEQIDHLLSSVSQADGMIELELWLFCTDHDNQCEPVIDLSGHSQLQALRLYYMHVVNLAALACSVKDVYLRGVTISEGQLRQFIHDLPYTPGSVNVELVFITPVADRGDAVVDLTDLERDDKLDVTCCHYDESYNTWYVRFSAQNQPVNGSGNFSQTCPQPAICDHSVSQAPGRELTKEQGRSRCCIL